MTLATKLKLAVIAGLVLSVPVAINIDRAVVSADDGEGHETVAQDDSERENNAVVYEYTAQSGDSYTKMARKAVQTYGKKFDVRLSLAQIIFAETSLTQQAGSPQIDLGQSVEISEDEVKRWVEAAQELTADQEAAWEIYVASVDFNTDNVGQAQQART